MKLLKKMGELIVSVAPVIDKLKKITSQYFIAMRPEINVTIPGLSLKLHPGEIAHQHIETALISLDQLATDMGIHFVIVFDEFQEILRIDPDFTLQASIRHAAERAQSITYLFSGSKHRPLRKIFNGKDNPLYELCDQLTLDKVSAKDYREYINKEATKKWGYPLNDAIIDKLLSYTDHYPKYINAICGDLWASELSPSEELIDELWHAYIIARKTDITENIVDLSLNQRRLLQMLSANPTRELYGQPFLSQLGLSQSSVQKAVEALLDKGFITNEDGLHKVLDPTIKAYFAII